eukprot:gene4013-20180_t
MDVAVIVLIDIPRYIAASVKNEDELDKLELEMDKESEDLDVNTNEIVNESGNVDTSEDDDYIVEEEDIEENENKESCNQTITSQ